MNNNLTPPAYRILMVEDDAGIIKALQTKAEKWNMQIIGCNDFQNVLAAFAEVQPHLVIMDIGLPFFDGYHWCQRIREISNVPILFLSAMDDSMNQVMAMHLGGDDYIVKPFDGDVLIAKIQALLRRAYDFSDNLPVLECQGAMLKPAESILVYQGENISLTKNELKILTTLFENKGQVVSREKLMNVLWESDVYIDDNTLTVNVNRLRRKLEQHGLADLIMTKFGVGYMVGGRQ